MNSKNTALLVIDVINSCAHKSCEIQKWNVQFSKIRKIIPVLKTFIEKYKTISNSKVIYTTTTPWKPEFLTDNINELYVDPEAYYYSDDNSGFGEKFFVVSPDLDDLIIIKNHYDTFTDNNFNNFLKKNKIRYLVVTGVFGDGCVLSTIISGFSKGYNFVILEDLIETTDSERRQNLLKLLKEYTFPKMYGITINSNQFLELWKDQTKL